jgi:glycosyltransferase 2 family protein
MNHAEKSFNNAFKSWKIWISVFLALSFALFMLFRSLNENHYVFVKKGKGTHSWRDSNGNKKVDLKNENEFFLNSRGDYRKKSSAEFLSEIKWTKQSFLYLGIALVFMFGRDFAYMWRIKILTKDKLNWKVSFFVIMLWEFASALSPGVVGGSAVAMFILNKEKIPLGKSTSIVVITALMDNLFYVILIPIIFLFISPSDLFPKNNHFDKGVSFVFWTGFTIIFSICFILFLSIFFYPKIISKLLNFVFVLPFLKKFKEKAKKTGEEVEISSREFKNEKWTFWLKTFVATFLSWTSRYLVINCIIAAFISLKFSDHFYILGKQLVLWLFMLISPTPGASGVAEYAFSELMSSFSSSLFLLSALAIIWRLISYFPYLIIGAFILPRWLKSTKN